MSMIRDIEDMIFDCFCDEMPHTSQEFREKALEKGIINSENTSAIGNTIFRIKDDPRFEIVDKGKYIIHKSDVKIDVFTVENAFEYLDKRINTLNSMNIFSSPDEEIENGLNEKKIYKEYIEKFSRILKSN